MEDLSLESLELRAIAPGICGQPRLPREMRERRLKVPALLWHDLRQEDGSPPCRRGLPVPAIVLSSGISYPISENIRLIPFRASERSASSDSSVNGLCSAVPCSST